MKHLPRLGIALALLLLSACFGVLSRMGPAAPAPDTMAAQVATLEPTSVVTPDATATYMTSPPEPTAAEDQAEGLPEFEESQPLVKGMKWITETTPGLSDGKRPFVDAVIVADSDLPICDPEEIQDWLDSGAEIPEDADIENAPTICKAIGFRPRSIVGDPNHGFPSGLVGIEELPGQITDTAPITVTPFGMTDTQGVVPSSINAAIKSFRAAVLYCDTVGCADNAAMTGVYLNTTGIRPTVNPGMESNYGYAPRSHIGFTTNLHKNPCPGFTDQYPNMSVGSHWGYWWGIDHTGAMEPFSEVFRDVDCFPVIYAWLIPDTIGMLYRMIQTSTIDATHAHWASQVYVNGGWVDLISKDVDWRDAVYLDGGLEVTAYNGDFSYFHLPMSGAYKIQIRGSELPEWSPWDGNGLSPTKYNNNTINDVCLFPWSCAYDGGQTGAYEDYFGQVN